MALNLGTDIYNPATGIVAQGRDIANSYYAGDTGENDNFDHAGQPFADNGRYKYFRTDGALLYSTNKKVLKQYDPNNNGGSWVDPMWVHPNASNVTTSIDGKAITDIFEDNGTTVKRATSDDDGNAIKATYGAALVSGTTYNVVKLQNKNGNDIGTVTVNDVANVTTSIKNVDITDIFEDDGTTAKNASNVTTKIKDINITDIFEAGATAGTISSTVQKATSASNVTTNIGGKAITSIFESNGTTVKNATGAQKLYISTKNSPGISAGYYSCICQPSMPTSAANNTLYIILEDL